MRIPRFATPNDIAPEPTALPSVATVTGGGYLSQCAPVAAFGTTAKTAIPFLLLSSEQRGHVERAVPGFSDLTDRCGPDYERRAVLRPNGSPGIWFNAENLWVAVPWLLSIEARVTEHTFGSRAVFALAHAIKTAT